MPHHGRELVRVLLGPRRGAEVSADIFVATYVTATGPTLTNPDAIPGMIVRGGIWAHHDGERILVMTGTSSHRLAPATLTALVADGRVRKDTCPLDDEVDIYVLPVNYTESTVTPLPIAGALGRED